MKELSNYDTQKNALEILKYVTGICEQLSLKYVLAWGTLIGAVRHQGFIPWDDDIDIAMPREDYDVLIKFFMDNKDAISDYSLYSIYNREDYYYLVTRVASTSTLIVPNNKTNMNQANHGVFIDVYPIDCCGQDYSEAMSFFKKQMRLEFLRSEAIRGRFKKTETSIIKTMAKIPVYFYAKMRGYKYFQNKQQKNVMKCGNGSNSYFCCWCGTGGMNAEKLIFSDNFFSERVKTLFEDSVFFIPKSYDRILRQVYGDYMALPPVEERTGHHEYKAYKI